MNKVKLRYYLRGLGIGIIVTALVMGIALKDGQPLSDAEIRARAAELGMVEGSSAKLSDLQGTPTPAETSPSPTEKPETQTTPVPEASGESTVASDAEVASETAVPSAAEASPEPVTIVISSGEGSYTVCKRLAEAGLVEDARDFDQYLIDNGYSKRISTGTYEIPMGADWEEIAKIISKSS